jgi:BirA family biotin operon repressor/biotin-[acetyl-CoA-carboxylase] ligase
LPICLDWKAWQLQRLKLLCNNLPEGYELREFEEISSTNAEALRCAGQIEKPTWFFAHKQTAGRGRGGKAWVDPVGNFAATVLLFPQGKIQDVALRSFVAGLAVHDALVEVSCGADEFSLKWPNDVLLQGKKLAGILLETSIDERGRRALAIGVGVNLNQAPAQTDLQLGALEAIGLASALNLKITPLSFFKILAQRFGDWETRFLKQGFEPIRVAWLARAARLGEVITARVGGEDITGRFDRIDDSGHLQLQTRSGARSIAAAEIYFRGT